MAKNIFHEEICDLVLCKAAKNTEEVKTVEKLRFVELS